MSRRVFQDLLKFMPFSLFMLSGYISSSMAYHGIHWISFIWNACYYYLSSALCLFLTGSLHFVIRLGNLSYRGADKSLARPGRKQARKHVRDARDFNNIETRAVIKFIFLQGKASKEIHAILTETLACFLPGRAKDLSAPLYNVSPCTRFCKIFMSCLTHLGFLWHTG